MSSQAAAQTPVSARTLVLAGGEHREAGAAALAGLGFTPMSDPRGGT